MLRNVNRNSVLEPRATVPKLWLVTEKSLVAHSCAKDTSGRLTVAAATITETNKRLADSEESMGVAPRGVWPNLRPPKRDRTDGKDAMECKSNLWKLHFKWAGNDSATGEVFHRTTCLGRGSPMFFQENGAWLLA